MAAVQAAVEKFAKATVGEPSERRTARRARARGGGALRRGEDAARRRGAEFVHGGDGNFLLPLLKDAGVALEEASWPDSYWLGAGRALSPRAAADRRPGLKKVHGAFEDVVAAHAPGESLLQYWGAVDSGFRAGKLAHASSQGARGARGAARAAAARPARATRQVRGPRVKCDLNGWREEAPRKPRNGFDAP
ncbi:amino oxidoreductase [Aureococcus anophagefferens]|uniref:Amino oxidoreductase n=1 Tax=Aureococcus anophagefferens TaxID=44056 RepID=A0ABR1GBD6_AURAN